MPASSHSSPNTESVRNRRPASIAPHSGFSLVELLIAASLASVVFVIAFTAMIRFGKIHYSLATQADLDREFRYAINLITDDFRGLSSIVIEVPDEKEADADELPTITISLPSLENAAGVTPSRTEVIYSIGEDDVLRRVYAEYSDQGIVLASKSIRLLTGVTDFDVNRVGGSSSFDLTLTSERKAGGHQYEKTLNTRVASRN
ncbi:PilW family protein [Cerasicoccus arenae]|nr:prepilin-type N-terminal cleavage/methylation domain-containing protein [Cerasicoccus arenae]